MDNQEHLQPYDKWHNIAPAGSEELHEPWLVDIENAGKLIVNLANEPGRGEYDEIAYALGSELTGAPIDGKELLEKGFKRLDLSFLPDKNFRDEHPAIKLKHEGSNNYFLAIFQRGTKEEGAPLTPLSYWMRIYPNYKEDGKDIMIKPQIEELEKIKVSFEPGGDSEE